MSKITDLRVLVRHRLKAAAEEICGVLDQTLEELEKEVCRQRKLLDIVLSPQIRLHRLDVHQLLERKEEILPEQQEGSSSLDQEDPEAPHIKEEQEEFWTNQEGEQLPGLEEADIIRFTYIPVQHEDNEEKRQSSQLHQRQTEENREAELPARRSTEQMEIEADGEDCGGPARNSVLHRGRRHYARKNMFRVFGCSECGKSYHYSYLLERHMRTHTGEKPFSCSLCGKEFTQKGHVTQHMAVHSAEKRFSCHLCHKRFTWRSQVKKHKCVRKSLQLHQSQTEENREAEPPASSSAKQIKTEADAEDYSGSARNSHPDRHLHSDSDDKTSDSAETGFSDHWKETRELQSGSISLKNNNMCVSDERCNTDKKSFSHSTCVKRFGSKPCVKGHVRTHAAEKRFSCSICGKRYTVRGNLVSHMALHSGEKRFSCSVCKKRFTWHTQRKRHVCVSKSSQLHQSQTEENKNREAERPTSSSAEQIKTETDAEDWRIRTSQELTSR